MLKKLPISVDIQTRIKQLTIATNRLAKGILIGTSRTFCKGVGFEFNTIREYQQGDDIRFIDWHASSRTNNILIREYTEEKNKIIILAVDISYSGYYSTQTDSKHMILAHISTVIALIAQHGNDLVGLILFSDVIEKYIPPSRGKFHVNTIIKTLFTFKSRNRETKSSVVFEELLKMKKTNAILFFISDCIDDTFQEKLPYIAHIYDTIIVRYVDTYEKQLPSIGFLIVEDIETGQIVQVKADNHLNSFLKNRIDNQNKVIKKFAVRLLDIKNMDNFIHDIVLFFRHHMRY